MATDTNSGPDTTTAAVTALETRIADVKDVIADTPSSEQDKEWQKSITLILQTLSEKLETLSKKPQGQAPEIRELEGKVDRLLAEIQSMKTPTPPAPQVTASQPVNPEAQSQAPARPSGSTTTEAPASDGSVIGEPTKERPAGPPTRKAKSWI